MDYNYNYSNAYSDPYITATSFDSDITNPTFHNSNQPCMLGWSYPNQYIPSPNTMNKNGIIITTLHRVSRDTTLPSYMVNHLTNTSFIYSFPEQPLEEPIDWEKMMEALEELE